GAAPPRRCRGGQRTLRRPSRLAGRPRPPPRRGARRCGDADRSKRNIMTLLTNHLSADHAARELRNDVRDGLTRSPKSLPPKWFYDAAGSDLFDRITRLPEYYPTR